MKNLARDYDVEMEDVRNKPKRKPRMRPDAPGDPSMDLVPPSMLPPKSVVPPTKKAGGGSVYARGAKVGSASKRADGCAQRGLTKGKMV